MLERLKLPAGEFAKIMLVRGIYDGIVLGSTH
jgi:hypothetical protein